MHTTSRLKSRTSTTLLMAQVCDRRGDLGDAWLARPAVAMRAALPASKKKTSSGRMSASTPWTRATMLFSAETLGSSVDDPRLDGCPYQQDRGSLFSNMPPFSTPPKKWLHGNAWSLPPSFESSAKAIYKHSKLEIGGEEGRGGVEGPAQ